MLPITHDAVFFINKDNLLNTNEKHLVGHGHPVPVGRARAVRDCGVLWRGNRRRRGTRFARFVAEKIFVCVAKTGLARVSGEAREAPATNRAYTDAARVGRAVHARHCVHGGAVLASLAVDARQAVCGVLSRDALLTDGAVRPVPPDVALACRELRAHGLRVRVRRARQALF